MVNFMFTLPQLEKIKHGNTGIENYNEMKNSLEGSTVDLGCQKRESMNLNREP